MNASEIWCCRSVDFLCEVLCESSKAWHFQFNVRDRVGIDFGRWVILNWNIQIGDISGMPWLPNDVYRHASMYSLLQSMSCVYLSSIYTPTNLLTSVSICSSIIPSLHHFLCLSIRQSIPASVYIYLFISSLRDNRSTSLAIYFTSRGAGRQGSSFMTELQLEIKLELLQLEFMEIEAITITITLHTGRLSL